MSPLSLGAIAIGAMAIDPATPNTVYAGTGEPNGSNDSYAGNGLYRSTDAGASWAHATMIDDGSGSQVDLHGLGIAAIQVNRFHDVFLAVSGAVRRPGSVGGRPGIYVSTDRGVHFRLTQPAVAATSLSPNPANPAIIFAGTSDGVLVSNDRGQTWSKSLTFSMSGVARTAVAVAPSDPRIVYALAADSGDSGNPKGVDGFFVSVDAGLNWRVIQGTVPSQLCATGDHAQCWYDLTLAVGPWDSRVVYAGGVRLVQFIFPDLFGNQSPQVNNLGSGSAGIHVDFHSLSFDGGNRLWAANDGGIYRSDHADNTFTNLNQTLSISEFEPGMQVTHDVVVGGLQDNGTVASQGSTSWEQIKEGDGGYAAVDPGNPAVIYPTYTFGQISKTTDSGANRDTDFADVTPQENGKPYGGDVREFYAPLVMSPNNSSILYSGSTRVWRTMDGAQSWTAGAQLGSQISAIGAVQGTDARAYAGTASGGVWVSDDANAAFTWHDISSNLSQLNPTSDPVTHITVDPNSSTTGYVTVGGFGHGHVFQTRNEGRTWVDLSRNLPDIPVNTLVLIGSGLVIGTDMGVFMSRPGSGAWVRLNHGLPNTVVMELVTANGLIWAATHGRGVWTLPVAAIEALQSGWVQLNPSSSPPARKNYALSSGPASRGEHLVLFGGFFQAADGTNTWLNDTWTWNGATWVQQHPAASPPARSDAALAYDAARNVVVLFGGTAAGGTAVLGDTWTWDGRTWTEQRTAGSPANRRDPGMAYDAARQRVVLFGGFQQGALNDTWTWDGASWTQQQTASSMLPRGNPLMTYDAARSQVLLFAGYSNGPLNDTWTWDGSTWTQRHPASSPPARSLGGSAYNGVTQRVVVFGGYTGTQNLGDTWTWDGATWTESQTVRSPSARNSMAMATDTVGNDVVLFSGVAYPSSGGFVFLNDTWKFR